MSGWRRATFHAIHVQRVADLQRTNGDGCSSGALSIHATMEARAVTLLSHLSSASCAESNTSAPKRDKRNALRIFWLAPTASSSACRNKVKQHPPLMGQFGLTKGDHNKGQAI